MNPLRTRLDEYLAMRRGLGYGLARQEKLLGQYLSFLDERAETQITVHNALAWAKLPAGGKAWWSQRLAAVRAFARYLVSVGEPGEVPSADLLPDQPHRAVPYLYSEQQILALMDAAGSLGPAMLAAGLMTSTTSSMTRRFSSWRGTGSGATRAHDLPVSMASLRDRSPTSTDFWMGCEMI